MRSNKISFINKNNNNNNKLLWTKLIKLGISEQLLEILQSMYSTATSSVKLSTYEVTHQFPCKKGVRQGCNLSPLLFSLFISDLEKELIRNAAGSRLGSTIVNLLMYADDLVLVSSSSSGLRKHLEVLQLFCEKSKLDINTDKTKICIFGRGADWHPFPWNHSILERVQTYKYLGVWLSSNGSFNVTRTCVANQAKKVSCGLLAILSQLNNPPIQIILHLYEVMLVPILCYGCEVWGFEEDKEIEKVQMKFLKRILHLPNSCPNVAVRGELGQLPIHLWWKESILKYWNRLCSPDIPILLKEAAHTAIVNAAPGRHNWVSRVMNIFNHAGLSSYFSEIYGCCRNVTNQIMNKYRDQYIQVWLSSLSTNNSRTGEGGNKLRTYRLFKSNFELEAYLCNIQNTAHRTALTRLRVGSHRLAIELGRYHKPKPLPIKERLCDLCNVVEDEYHFLCICPKYIAQRQEMEKKLVAIYPEYSQMNCEQKFVFLLQSNNIYINKLVAVFVYYSFQMLFHCL